MFTRWHTIVITQERESPTWSLRTIGIERHIVFHHVDHRNLSQIYAKSAESLAVLTTKRGIQH